MTVARDLPREHRFLVDAAGGERPFVEHVEQRLADGEERFGTSWRWIGIHRHLTELREEAADLGAWAVLCDQALDHDRSLTAAHKQQIRSVLAGAAKRGALAHEMLSNARRSLETRP